MIRNTLPMSLMIGNLQQNVTDLKARMQSVSTEAVTGRVSDVTKHLNGRIGSAMLGQKALDDLATEKSQLHLRASRLDVVQNSLEKIQSGMDGLSARMLDAVGFSSEVDLVNVTRDAELELGNMLSRLNARHGERYLFAGDATSTPPFAGADQLIADIEALAGAATDAADFEAQLDAYFTDPAGGWQQTIYRGTATASDSEAKTAIDPAITELARGLAVMAISGPGGAIDAIPDADTARMTAANTLAAGQTALTNMRADVGIDQRRLSDRLSDLDREKTILTETFNQMTARDQYDAAAELKVLEANLETSYALTARLSNLSLMNFLR
ncbi:flagellin [Henriciella sp. AS95]|uniref:flagellin n=1 Tax=Henriciella sp. AS95 TaxID=3135782 RepID=UPI0031723839